jgi:hypothetical protein
VRNAAKEYKADIFNGPKSIFQLLNRIAGLTKVQTAKQERAGIFKYFVCCGLSKNNLKAFILGY